MNDRFWRGRRVLVTGHTGFKGSWLSLWLQEMGARVAGFALPPPTRPSLYESARVGEGMESHMGDLRDLEALTAVVRHFRPEVIFHLAAQPLVRRSYQEPVETYTTNVIGTVHLLEAVRRCETVQAVVNVTSDKCYHNREWEWGYRESDPMGGADPYSSSKGCAELVTDAWRHSYFSSGPWLASARAGNVIGGGDWAEDRLIPDLLTAFARGEAAPIRNPHAVRPWQHVLEPLAGYLLLAERLVHDGAAVADGWNFGPADEEARPVGWIADRLAELWGEGAHWQSQGGDHPHEATWLKLDSSRARLRLGWSPRWGLEEALRRVVEWHRAHADGADLRAVTLEQIHAYRQIGGGEAR